MFIDFNQFNRKIYNSCKWFRWDTYTVYTECRNDKVYYVSENEKDINFCSKCGKEIEWVKK